MRVRGERRGVSPTWKASTLTLFLAFVAGCGGPRPYPVAGRLVYADGEPFAELAGGEVIFTSDQLRISSSGEIDREGRFVLTMRSKGDGTFPGEYKVVIVPAVDLLADDPRHRRPKPHLPAKYTDPRTTDLSATVEAKANDLTLALPFKKGGGR